MAEYEKLSRLYYKLSPSEWNKELEARISSYGCYRTPFRIRAFRKGRLDKDAFQAFYVNIPRLMALNNEVLSNSSKIIGYISRLPEFVVEPYFHKLIVDEAQSNNEIEGVRSTKKELSEVLRRLHEPKAKRFKGLMKTYLHIESIPAFHRIEDFRKLYDELVADEIDPRNAPDGKLFRTGYVEVNDGANVTHIGVHSEEQIELALGELIRFLESDDHPELYRYMAAHYYYEYIHPFYDGNGRTGRLLVCSYLARYLDRYSAITFSNAINKDKQKYYKALEEVPSPLNRGELTFFLMDMLQLLLEGQRQLLDDLAFSFAKKNRIDEFFGEAIWRPREEERQLLEFLTLVRVFNDSDPIVPLESMMRITGYTRYMANKHMGTLIDEGYVEIVSHRPKAYKLSEVFLSQILP